MRRGRALSMSLAAAFVLMSAASFAAPPKPRFDGPPAGIVPTEAKIPEVLARWKSAVGVEPKGASIEDWTLPEKSVTGSEHDIHWGDDYREVTTIGPVSYQY